MNLKIVPLCTCRTTWPGAVRTLRTIKEIFSLPEPEKIWSNFDYNKSNRHCKLKPRILCDLVL